MLLSSLELNHFRNLQHIYLRCSPHLNLIIGANASGKTSILEALYFLGRARSFRTHQIQELIQYGESAFRIVAILTETENSRCIPVGIQRSLREISIRIDGAIVDSLAQLAIHLPVLLLNTASHQLLENGPQQRRRFMDWGLFHTERTFLMVWKRYSAALRNRNAALRTNASDRVIKAWDEELVSTADVLARLRKIYCNTLQTALRPLVTVILEESELEIDYRCGWTEAHEQDLLTTLHDNLTEDRRYGYTRLGPHRADFIVKLNGRIAPACLSRGQQKLLVIALLLAQAHLYRTHNGFPCILLIDDLSAELDHTHRDRVMGCLKATESQLFITAIEAGLLDIEAWSSACVFNVEQGSISE
jgi:DNA replication and repair protein RecF